jgi:phenylalanyl-tRNA synthetase alpha chain
MITGGSVDDKQIHELRIKALALIDSCSDLEEVEQARVQLLGRKGSITQALRQLTELPISQRKLVGERLNALKKEVEQLISDRIAQLERQKLEHLYRAEAIDVTFPAKSVHRGYLHVLYRLIDEICEIFHGIGYTVVEGPEIESDYYNFEALNIPQDHPARDMLDSFYIEKDILLRTHTSPVQIRAMEASAPPIYVVAPGRVYRRDNPDATRSPVFHQIECLAVDKNLSVAELKATIDYVVRSIFGHDRKVRLRPDYFPFTEPSYEVSVSCGVCGGVGCRSCRFKGWLEILGAGVVHPRVLQYGGIDPNEWRGFAFGMGIERIAMLKYGVEDIRLFFENDIRFTSQFGY